MPFLPLDWSRVRSMFEAAIAMPADQRQAYVDAECGADRDLRDQVVRLIASHERATEFPDTAPALVHLTPSSTGLEGCQLGPYQLSARLGAGGMGEVYQALDTRLHRTVAIKVLPAHVAGTAQARERFEREARAVAALNHPNICTLHDIGEVAHPERAGAEPIRFLVMEFVDGTTLDLAGELPLDPARVAAIAAQVCDALDAAHATGIVHRDVKPANLMITARGQVKVLDFGVAKIDRPAGDPSTLQTGTGLILGTVPYMSPEQVCGGTVSAASDVFSLGVVLYRLLTARHPFAPDEQPAQMQALVQSLLVHTPKPPHRYQPGIPPRLETIVLRMLDKEPAARPSAAQIKQVLLDPETLAGSTATRPSHHLQRHGLKGDAHDHTTDSVAVLPFTNTGGADAEYLSDGIAESLINSLSGVSNLRVVPRSTVFRYKNTDRDPSALGRELQVRLLLTGKVMQRGDRLMVQADLIDATEQKQLWGERFNRPSSDIFEVEEEIARQILEKLRLKLSGDEERQIADRYTDDPGAYDLYLKARHHWTKRTPESIRRAIDCFEAAIGRDAHFARAWAGLADTRILFGWYGAGVIRELFDSAIAAARTAVSLDPELGEARAALGFGLCCTGQWNSGLRECERAIQLSPGYFLAHDWLAIPLAALGRFDEALAAMRRAKTLEPLSPVVHHHDAWVNTMTGQFAEAAGAARQALELDANYSFGWWWLGIAQTELGQTAEAVRSLQRARDIFGDFSLGHSALGHAYGRAGQREEALACMQALRKTDPTWADPYHVALVHAGLGQWNDPVACLTEASDANSAWLRIYGPHDPRLNALRGDPRLDDLLRRSTIN